MEEIWKPIKGYEGYYEVSNKGRVRRLPYTIVGKTRNGKSYLRYFEGGILKGSVCRNGYVRVTLNKDGVVKYCHVHRLVAEAFIPNPDNLPLINHIDEVRTNNYVFVNKDGSIDPNKSNLEWCTYHYNNTYKDARKRFAESFSKNHTYPVYMFSQLGERIQKFASVKEAANAVGVTYGTIYRAISKTRKTAAGYVWEKA